MAADGLYHRLVLLVGVTGSGKTAILRDLALQLGTTVINVNLLLSAALLELTAKQRRLHLPELFARILADAQTTLVLDNLEILFDKDLQQDPLRLLLSISRHRTIVASWNGTTKGKKLIYAEIGHPEYRSYENVDALLLNMDGASTLDAAWKNTEVGLS